MVAWDLPFKFFLPHACIAKVQTYPLIKVYHKPVFPWKMLAQWTCYFQLQTEFKQPLVIWSTAHCFPCCEEVLWCVTWKKFSPLYSASISGSTLEPGRDYCSWLLFIKFRAGLLFSIKNAIFPPPISSRLLYFLGSSGAIYMPFGSCKKFCSQLSNWMEVTCSPAQTDGLV